MAASLPVAEVLSMYGHSGAFDNRFIVRCAKKGRAGQRSGKDSVDFSKGHWLRAV